ncbi:unnamed protein product [Rotaria sp. Silwood1]|nr:unnamed protein product [Rotaria sp. Silwood1]
MFYSRTIPISIVPSLNFPTGEIPLQNLNKEQASFLWYQLLIKVLKRIPSTSVSHNDLLTKCRLEHSNNNIKLGEIQEFEDTYNSDNVIAWYTRDAFLYRLINKALKEKDIIVMYKFRFVLIDLHDRLVQLHGAYINSLKSHESTISELVVFHGQGLTLTELQNLKGNIKGRISMNSFLVASTSREIALLSAGNGSGRQVVESVFFEIHCPIMNYFTKPFAHIQQYSYSKTKDEILFSIGTVFHLAFVETLTDQLWHVIHLSVFTTEKEESSMKNLKTENPSRMWFNLLIEILLRMPQTEDARNEMIAECKLFYADNPVELKKIDDFQTNYTPTNAIKWYTYDCFLFRQFNKACRTKNIDALYNLRFFLIDLQNQLQNLFESQLNHMSSNFTVYRGQLIAPSELQKLKGNVGQLVSMNTYLSTTKSCAVASDYAGNGSGHPFIESVVFEIEVDVKKAIKPFANIEQVSIMTDEGEILFSIGTIFKIESVKEVLDNVWFVKLTLSETSDLEILRNYLFISGEHDHANKYSKTQIKSMINDLTNDFGPSEKYFSPLGPMPGEKGYTSAKKQRQKELEMNIGSLPANDPLILELYNNAGILNLFPPDIQQFSY